MNDRQLHDVLERLSQGAPQIDGSGMAHAATARADRSRRRRFAVAVPAAAAAAAAVVVVTAAGLHSPTDRPGGVAAGSPAGTPSAAASAARATNAAQPSIAYQATGNWTCCGDADRAERVQPGGSFVAHFRRFDLASTGPTVTFTVTLTGPYADAAAMMADPPRATAGHYASPPLRIPAGTTADQIATVPVPATAAPGLYLVSLVSGGSAGSAGSVQITR